MTRRSSNFVKRRIRWLIGIAVSVVVYAIFGFFVAPWVVKNQAIEAVGQNLDAELRLEKVAINPFVLSLRIDGLVFDGSDGEPIASIGQIFVNFQLSSLFRWAWTFAEIRFDAPELFLARDGSGALNLGSLLASEAEPAQQTESDSGSPRLLIHDFSVNDGRVDWRDAVPPEPVETVFGPVSVRVTELNTLPERAGEQEVLITTESQGTLSWNGSLQLNPFASIGRAAIRGSHFPLTSAYIRHETGIDIKDGVANVELDYSVSTDTDGTLRATVDDLDILFSDLRISTFHAEPDDVKQPREFLIVPSISLTGGKLRWSERELSAKNFEIGDAVLDFVRLEDGRFDFATLSSSPEPADEAEQATTPQDSAPWRLVLDRFAIRNLVVGLDDRSVTPAADTGLNAVNLEVLAISNEPEASFPTTLSAAPLRGGIISLDGSVVALPEAELDFKFTVGGVSLAAAHPYIKPMADVSLDSGTLSVDGRIRHDVNEPLLFTSDIVIADFLVTETDEGTRLGSWDELLAEGVVLSIANNALEVSELRLERPYADILIADDGSVNLGRVSRLEPDEPDESADTQVQMEESKQAMQVQIGSVVINDAAADFTDESLPLPFAARTESLNGTLSTIATDSVEPSRVKLEGKVDEFGLVRVNGFVTPLDVTRNTSLNVVFSNVEMPKFSAYTIPFAGREIAVGRLDLDLGYAVTERQLAGENKIVLRDFELGDEIEHPRAMSLPLGLAVALLKDPSGKIDIDLPVRGDLDDPEFGYGRVIEKGFVNLILKIATSPFALLGNLVGVEPDELEYINFLPGRADLTPPEIERTQKIAEALALRPELVLEISGVIERKADMLALKTAHVDAAVEERIEAGSDAEEAAYSEQRSAAIESLFRESAADTVVGLDSLRTQYTAIVVDKESGKEVERFDEPAFTEELRRQLIDAQPVAEEELVDLAKARATNARDAVLLADSNLVGRLAVVDLREEDGRESDETVRMKVSLTTGQTAIAL